MAGGFNSYSTTPASNTSLNSINVGEGCNPSGINDAIRQVAADGRDLYDKSAVWAGTAGGTANAQTLSLAVSALVTGQSYRFIAAATNTAAATLNINSLGATNIKRVDGSSLQAGDIVNGQLVTVCYTGTNFILLRDITPQFRGALYVLTVAQSIANTTNTRINFALGGLVYDTNTFWAAGNPGRLTVPTGVSVVRLHGAATFTVNNWAMQVTFWKNGAAFNGGINYAQNSATALTATAPIVSPPLQVAAGDYLELIVWQNSGGAANCLAGGTQTYFGMEVIQ